MINISFKKYKSSKGREVNLQLNTSRQLSSQAYFINTKKYEKRFVLENNFTFKIRETIYDLNGICKTYLLNDRKLEDNSTNYNVQINSFSNMFLTSYFNEQASKKCTTWQYKDETSSILKRFPMKDVNEALVLSPTFFKDENNRKFNIPDSFNITEDKIIVIADSNILQNNFIVKTHMGKASKILMTVPDSLQEVLGSGCDNIIKYKDGTSTNREIEHNLTQKHVESFLNKTCDDEEMDNQLHYSLNSWQPIGFENPRGYCYLNSVVQVLVSCVEFRNDIESYRISDCLEPSEDLIFVKGFFSLISSLLVEDQINLNKALMTIQTHVTESSLGDDVHKCFLNILTRIDKALYKYTEDHDTRLPMAQITRADKCFNKYRNEHCRFIFDNFIGQISSQVSCKTCGEIYDESFQMMKSLSLPVLLTPDIITMQDCIDLYFLPSDVDYDQIKTCICTDDQRNLKFFIKLTHVPKYLFIYLNRGSFFVDGVKNNTFVKCGNDISIDTTTETNIPYKLISTIDHIGDNHGGHYYCKCSYETDTWWLLNDKMVMKLTSEDEIVSENTIVFLFKKFSDSSWD